MEMSGEQRIPAPRERVWTALNDPETLQASIPGCQSLGKTGDNGFEATVKAKVGPVSATFVGNVELSNIDAPHSYTISGEGKGGVAGFAKGRADVTLEPDGDETLLSYRVTAQVGGKLAQIGSRLIDSTAKKMAGQFFGKFSEQVTEEQVDGAPSGTSQIGEKESSGTGAEQPAMSRTGNAGTARVRTWIIGIVIAGGLLLAVIYFGSG